MSSLLNRQGVCLALAMGFAFMHLQPQKQSYGPEFFNNFLNSFSTPEGIQSFFEEYERLSEDYTNTRNADLPFKEKEEVLKAYWNKLALIDLMILIYAQNPRNFLEQGWLNSVAVNGVDATINSKTLAMADLQIDGSMSCLLAPQDLKDFFFAGKSFLKKTISPFKKGGTYLVILPKHACALHMSLDGTIKFYDPNFQTYVFDPEQLATYQQLFGKYTRQNKAIPIEVYAVSLKNTPRPDDILRRKIIKRLQDSSDCFLRQHFHPSDCIRMIQKGYFRALFYNNSTTSRYLLKQALDWAEKNNINDFWDNIEPHQDLPQSLIRELFYAIHQLRDFELLRFVCAYKKITPLQSKRFDMLSYAIHEMDIDFIRNLIEISPLELTVNKKTLSLLDAQVAHQETQAATVMFQSLLKGDLYLSDVRYESLTDLMNELYKNMHQNSFQIAIRCWVDYHKERHLSSTCRIEGSSLLFFMIEHDYPQEDIAYLINSGIYTFDEKDYKAVLLSEHSNLKVQLLIQTKDYYDWERGLPLTPLEMAIQQNDTVFLTALLNNHIKPRLSFLVIPYLLQHFYNGSNEIIAVLSSNSQCFDIAESHIKEQKSEHQKLIVIEKLFRKMPLTQEDTVALGSMLEYIVDYTPSEKIKDIVQYALSHQWPLHQARHSKKKSLFQHWLETGHVTAICSFWQFCHDFSGVSKDSLRQMTVALVNANSHENPSWQEEWVYRTGLSLNDFIPGHEDLMKDLYDERQPARNFLLLQALIAGTCSEYSQALLSSFKRRLIDLKKPHTREELEKIIHDLDDIRNLMLCTGGSDKHYFYSDILAIINQIKSVLPVLENSTTDADALIRNLFSDPAITQLQQYAAEQQIIEPVAQQPKCVSLLSWLLFFRRSDEG